MDAGRPLEALAVDRIIIEAAILGMESQKETSVSRSVSFDSYSLRARVVSSAHRNRLDGSAGR
jgi:hypothetical protein